MSPCEHLDNRKSGWTLRSRGERMKNMCVCGGVWAWKIFIHLPLCLGSNTLDPLVTNPSQWLNDGPRTSLNLLLINLSPCITLNIRSSWCWTLSICLCISGRQLLLEKPTRYISVIKRSVFCLKEAWAREWAWDRVEKGRVGKHERFRLQIRWGSRIRHEVVVHLKKCSTAFGLYWSVKLNACCCSDQRSIA